MVNFAFYLLSYLPLLSSLYEKNSWNLRKVLVHKFKSTIKLRTFFAIIEVKIILWSLITVSHILTVSNYQVCSDDDFDFWSVYSGERFTTSWPSCYSYWWNAFLN